MKIDAQCKLIAENLLINVEKKKIYSLAGFEDGQSIHHVQVKDFFSHSCRQIQESMSSISKFSEADSEEVQREWIRYTEKIDKKMEESLRHTVKKSLQELSRVLNGDNRTEVPHHNRSLHSVIQHYNTNFWVCFGQGCSYFSYDDGAGEEQQGGAPTHNSNSL